MLRTAILAGALIAAAGLSQASAQSWSVGVGVDYGGPVYYGPPPAYIYEQPPVVYVPAPQMVPSAVSPDAVFDALERAGYREFSPMAFRDGVYKLNAVNRRGDLVALEVSVLTGEVQREYVLAVGTPRAPAPAAPPAASPLPREPSHDPLVVY